MLAHARGHRRAGRDRRRRLLHPAERTPGAISSDPALAPELASEALAPDRDGETVTYNGVGDVLLAGSRFEVSGRHADVLLRTLPPVIHLKAEGDQVALHWSSELMMQELREGRPGASLVAQHLAHLMLAQTLRLYLSQQSGVEIGWFAGLAGPQEGAVIRAIHADPGHGWTLEDLWHIQACHEPLLHDVSAKKWERRRSHTLRAGE